MKNLRQKQIIQLLEQDGAVTTAAIAEHFGVSIETIRRDFREMKKQGTIRKIYGGAEHTVAPPEVAAFPIRYSRLHETKSLLAQQVAAHIPTGSIVALDSGTTIFECVKALSQHQAMSYICSDIHSATELLSQGNTNVYLLGGKLAPHGTVSGVFVQEFLSSIAEVDILIMSCDGADPDSGLSCDEPNINTIKQALMKKAKKTIAVLDHTKFTKRGFYKTCDFSDISLLVTDTETPEAVIHRIQHFGVATEIVPCFPTK